MKALTTLTIRPTTATAMAALKRMAWGEIRRCSDSAAITIATAASTTALAHSTEAAQFEHAPAATFALLWGFPLLLLGTLPAVGVWVLAFGWAFAAWGTALYWWAGLRYVHQAVHGIGAAGAGEPAPSAHDI